MNNLARGGTIGRFQAQEWVSAWDERRPIQFQFIFSFISSAIYTTYNTTQLHDK